ncbi:MAG: putative transport system permease protein [Actinomycetota bacterium]|nr:putative transport system permease protein [Actinomycetota bacterium]
MGAIRLLNLRRVRRQPLRAAIAVIAVAAGVALAVSIQVVSGSLNASFDAFSRSIAGPTPLRVVGATVRGGIDQSVIAKVRAVPDVAAAIPMVQAVVMAEDSRGHQVPIVAFGVDCSVERLVGALGCDQAAISAATDAPPIISASLARSLGPGGAIRTDLGRITLAGTPASPKLDRLNKGRVAVFALPTAQRQFVRPGAVDVIYVQPRKGASLAGVRTLLARAVGPQNGVLATDDPPAQVGIVTQVFIPLFSVISLFALGVGAVLVYNTLALSMEERRRQLAIVGAIGGSGRLVIGGTLVEAGALGLVGGLLGALGGIGVAHPVTASLNDFTQKGLGMPVDVHVGAGSFVLGAVLGAVLGMVAAIGPARRAMRIDVAAELSNRDLRADAAPRARVGRIVVSVTVALVGVVTCIVAQRGGALHPWQAALSPLAFVIAAVAMLVAVGALAPVVLGSVAQRLRRPRATTRLGLANLVREPGRTGVMAVAIGTAVALGFTLSTFNRSVRAGITKNVTAGDQRWLRVSTLEPNNTINIDSMVSPELIARVRAVPGVGTVERAGGLISGHEVGKVTGVWGTEGWRTDFPLLQGRYDRARYEAGDVFIGPGLARDTGARVGDFVTVDTRLGTAKLRVLAIWQNGDFGGRNVGMALPQIERVFGPQPTAELMVHPAAGVSAGELARRIEGAELDPFLQVRTPAALADQAAADIGQQLSSFWAIQRAMLLVAFVAVLSTLLLVGVQRRRELGLLAAVGMPPADLARMVVSEAGSVAATGIGLGAATGTIMSSSIVALTVVLIGYKDPLSFDFLALPAAAIVTLFVVVAAAVIPAWRTSRLEVLEALQYE